MSKKKVSDAVEILDRMVGDDQDLRELVERETINACVAQIIYDARTEAGLSQRQLAKLIRTSQPTIARLEDANYSGHSLTMLARVAAALGKRVKIGLVDAPSYGSEQPLHA